MDARNNSVRHPDENLLAAFAEETLTAQERQSLLQHLSECSRCREIVFLAQDAAPASVASSPREAPSSFVWKRPLLWGYALALVILAGGTLSLLHIRQSPAPSQPAQPVAQVPPQQQQPQPTLAAPVPQPALPTQTPKPQPAERGKAAPTGKVPQQQQIEAQSASPGMDQNNQLVSGLQAPPAAAPAQSLNSLSALGPDSGYAMAPTSGQGPFSAPAPARFKDSRMKKAQARTAVVSADMQGAESPQTSAAIPLTMGALPVQASPSMGQLARFELQNGHIQRCIGKDCTLLTLPDQKNVTSLATKRNVTFALDSEGKLFVSRTEGSTWETIPTQWRGRARNVSVIENGQRHQPWNRLMRQPDTAASAVHGTTTTPSILQLQALPVPVFSLTNEEGESWQTFDLGKNWKKVEKPPVREEP